MSQIVTREPPAGPDAGSVSWTPTATALVTCVLVCASMIGAIRAGLGVLGMHAAAVAPLAGGALWYFSDSRRYRHGAALAVGAFLGYWSFWIIAEILATMGGPP